MQLQGLQDEAALTQKHRESLTIALRQNVTSRQNLAETFFRDCLDQLDKLSASQMFSKEATAVISRMTSEISKAWTGHQKQQTEEFSQMAGLVEALRASYKAMPEALVQENETPLLPKSAQEFKEETK